MAKYLKSDSITESYVVTKIPLRQPISNLSERAVVPRRFSQKDNGIWSPDHYPCLALGLVFQNQEKHFWGLVFSTCRSSMNFGNIPWSKGAWLNLCIFVVTSLQPYSFTLLHVISTVISINVRSLQKPRKTFLGTGVFHLQELDELW